MQSTNLLNHSFELRLAFSLFTAVALFAVVRVAYFIDEKATAILKRREENAEDTENSCGQLALAAR